MGCEVHYQRGNAIKLVGRLLATMYSKSKFNLGKWTGGEFYRFIPRTSEVVIAFENETWTHLELILQKEKANLIKKYRRFTDYGDNLEPNINISWQFCEPESIYAQNYTNEIIALVNLIPHGLIIPYNPENEENHVCNNLAIIESLEQEFLIHLRMRWANEIEYEYFTQQMTLLATLSGWTIKRNYYIPIWNPKPHRKFTEYVKKQYEQVVFQPIRITKSFWTMELGILEAKYPELECVSVGPTEIGVYPSPYTIKLSHIEAIYNLLKKIITRIDQLSD